MRWQQPVNADQVRARWLEASWRFSPLAGWPPREYGPSIVYDGGEARAGEVAAALGVVSSRSAYWETQALIVEFCSHREADPAPQWSALAGLETDGQFRGPDEVLSAFLNATRPAVPPGTLIAASQTMRGLCTDSTLNGLGLVVGRMAAPDYDECVLRCKDRPPTCIWDCLGGR
jgi:hypothetical protein